MWDQGSDTKHHWSGVSSPEVLILLSEVFNCVILNILMLLRLKGSGYSYLEMTCKIRSEELSKRKVCHGQLQGEKKYKAQLTNCAEIQTDSQSLITTCFTASEVSAENVNYQQRWSTVRNNFIGEEKKEESG